MHHGIAAAIGCDLLIADEIATKFRSEKQIRKSFIAKPIANATVSSLQKNRLLESGQALQLFNSWPYNGTLKKSLCTTLSAGNSRIHLARRRLLN